MVISAKDVAKRANVSIATVSLAMRGNRRISEQTCKKVLNTARELGYRTNASAKMLSTGRSDVLGVTIFNMRYLAVPYVSSIMSGIADLSDDKGLNLAFARSAHKRYEEPEYIQLAREGRFAGEIIIDQMASEKDLRILSDMNIPIVLVDRKIPGFDIPVVRINYSEAVKKAVSHLISLGHKRIGVVSGSEDLFDMKEKLLGYHQALKEHDILFDQDLVGVCRGNSEGEIDIEARMKESVNAILGLPNPPTAIVCFIDSEATDMCDVIRYHNLRIPEDISVVCFNDTGSTQNGFLIGRIQVPGYEMGKRACQLMLDLLQQGQVATKDVTLDAKFEPRDGCSPPRKPT